METLGKLFGGEAKTKIIRLFLFNPEAHYTALDVSSRTGVAPIRARKALIELIKSGLIRTKLAPKENKGKKAGAKAKKARESAYHLDQKFPHIAILSDLMVEASVRADSHLAAKIMVAGKVKLILAAGIFVHQNDARLDLLIVSEDINENKLARAIKSIETDMGRDLAYSSLTSSDFQYRLGLHDRLVRDIIDFPHIVLVDRIGFRTRK